MASRPQNKAIGGVTPLGVITVVPGTPKQIISALNLTDKVGFTFSARALGFSVSSTVAGEAYINYGNFPNLDANATVLIVQSGQAQSLPIGGSVTEGLIDVEKYWVDGSAAVVVAVYAADASS